MVVCNNADRLSWEGREMHNSSSDLSQYTYLTGYITDTYISHNYVFFITTLWVVKYNEFQL